MNASAPLAAIFGMSGSVLTDEERDFFNRVRPLGYIVFARNIENPSQISALTQELRSLTPNGDPLILIDQEGGRVQRLIPPHWRFAPSMAEFGELYVRSPERALEALKTNMTLIGRELCDLGIDVDCAPVMDVPVSGAHDVIGDRAFSTDPMVVSAMAPFACAGLREAGVVPVIKHLPGHGRAIADSHKELPIVSASLLDLRASDFVPFKALCAARGEGVCFGMTAHVVYKSIDPKRPATISKTVIGEIIRGEIGFHGLLMSDDLGMKALAGPFDERAAASLEAGCDVVLHCDGNLSDMELVAKGAKSIGPNVAKALEDAAGVRLKPRTVFDNELAADFQVMDALRRG
jgi:beta-N-acetylhexosaminidase